MKHGAVGRPIEETAQKTADDRSANPEPGRQPEAHHVGARNERASEQPHDEPDENRPQDVQHAPASSERRSMATGCPRSGATRPFAGLRRTLQAAGHRRLALDYSGL